MATTATEKHPQVLLRMPASLKERLMQAATRSSRSITAEINLRLEASLTDEVDKTNSTVSLLTRALQAGERKSGDGPSVTNEGQVKYEIPSPGTEPNLSNLEDELLKKFSTLPLEKQMALVMLLR